MKATFKSKHRNSGKRNPARKGQWDFVYNVTGTKEELADFKATQKEFFLEGDNGESLMTVTQDHGKNPSIIKRKSDDRWIIVSDKVEVKIEKLAGLAGKFPQFAAQFGAEAAHIAAADESVAAPVAAQVTASAETAKL